MAEFLKHLKQTRGNAAGISQTGPEAGRSFDQARVPQSTATPLENRGKPSSQSLAIRLAQSRGCLLRDRFGLGGLVWCAWRRTHHDLREMARSDLWFSSG